MAYTSMRDGETVAAKKAAAAGLLAATPAASAAPKRLTMDQLISQGKVGRQVFDPLYQQLGNASWATDGGMNEAGQSMTTDTPNDAAYSQLKGYTFDWADTGAGNTGTLTAYDPSGKQIGAYQQQDSSGWDAFKDYAMMGASALGGLGAIGLGPLSGLLGGASGAGSATGGAIGAGEGAAQLAAYSAANPLTVAEVMATTLPAGGLPGLTAAGAAGAAGGLLAGVPAESLASLEAFTAANPLTAAQVTASTLPAGGLPGLSGGLLAGVPAEAAASLDAYTAANPLTASNVTASTLPAGGLPGLAAPVAAAAGPAAGNGAFLGEGVASGVPAWDAAAGSSIGTIGQAAAWMKANPLLGRLLTSGATTLLSGMGGSSGSSGGSSGAAVAPTPTKWNSPIQQGLLSNVQQYAPPAVQRSPGGLLAQGFQNDGAWRYMGG